MSDLPVSDVQQLRDRLEQGSSKQKFQAIQELAAQGQSGETVLTEVLRQRVDQPITAVEGSIMQVLASATSPEVQVFLSEHWGEKGLVPLPSERGIDYSPIQQALVHKQYEEADRLTLQKMCELAGPIAARRKWLYFSDVDQFPIADLHVIDHLWRVYSEDKFGFSIQRELWLNSKKDWERLWPKIGWKSDNGWTRYPNEFTWDLSAPRGHLPLSNQLRGVRVMASLMNHPAWVE
ncbi:MAG: GUN4 N-terminal ARM-like repeat domain-containing protein [Leptolyngbyaceae cyanobacterium]